MKINNVILKDLDLLEKETALRVENSIDKVIEVAKNTDGLTTLSAIIEVQCGAIKTFFDEVFGESTSQKLFGDRENLKECIGAFKEFKLENDRLTKKQLEGIKF